MANPRGYRDPISAARPQGHASMGRSGSSPSCGTVMPAVLAGMPAGATTPRPWWILDMATRGTTVITAVRA